MLIRRKALTALAAAAMLSGLAMGSASAAAPVADQQQSIQAIKGGCGWYSGNAITKRGDKGDRVYEVQCLLLGWGYSVGSSGMDGDFGRGTESGVKAFQRDRGLAVDGVVGKNTWAALRR